MSAELMNKLLRLGEGLEQARGILQATKDMPGVHVGVSDCVAAAIRDIDNALVALDGRLGAAARASHRNRPRKASA